MLEGVLKWRYILKTNKISKRNFYDSLNFIFNRVDKNRVKEVGHDRACAEWLMRNGAFVRWLGDNDFVGHYNSLPLDEPPEVQYFIEEVKAIDASINHQGFPHFRGCKFIKTMKLSSCWYVNDTCLERLSLLQDSLINLEVSNCGEITDSGLKTLGSLKHLETLFVGDLLATKDLDGCVAYLKSVLPNCRIEKIKKH